MEKNPRRKEAELELELELELPKEIIQHFQSFLDGNEAAQTTLLSRSWYRAWLTRPNLDFDQKHFANKPDHDFWKSVTTTVERYEKLKINIDSLRLWIIHHTEHSLVNESIIKALKAGATCLDFKIHDNNSEFTFPNQVFGFENLARLTISGCKIVEENNGISCSRLKCLTLKDMDLQGNNNIIWDLISSCPLLEDFSLSTIFKRRHLGPLPEYFEKHHLSNEFHKLKSLFLSGISVGPSFFDHFSRRFPTLVDLALFNYRGGKDIQISSPSLECITFGTSFFIRGIKFDVPKIRKFTLLVPNIPLVSFEKTNTSNWSSTIHIKRESAPTVAWFLELSGLLKKLRSLNSKIALSLYMWSEKPSELSKEIPIYCDSKPEVVHMRINGPYASFPDFYSSLFKICHPRSIEPYWIPRFRKNWGIDEFIWKRKMQQACLDSCIAHQRMSDCNLSKVKMVFFDESYSKRRTQSVDTASTTILGDAGDDEQVIFFYLKWGPKILGIRRELE